MCEEVEKQLRDRITELEGHFRGILVANHMILQFYNEILLKAEEVFQQEETEE